MLLRFLLVSLVAGLGFEMPDREVVSTWRQTGAAWIQARLDDFNGVRLVAARDAADHDFARINDDQATEFTGELALLNRPRSAGRLAFEPIEIRPDAPNALVASFHYDEQGIGDSSFEPIVVAEPAQSGLIASFDYDQQGVGRIVEIAGPPSSMAVATAVEPAAPVSNRSNRLASALRLTRQAATAWVGLLEGGDISASVRR